MAAVSNRKIGEALLKYWKFCSFHRPDIFPILYFLKIENAQFGFLLLQTLFATISDFLIPSLIAIRL